jgi:hypothetical protein
MVFPVLGLVTSRSMADRARRDVTSNTLREFIGGSFI